MMGFGIGPPGSTVNVPRVLKTMSAEALCFISRMLSSPFGSTIARKDEKYFATGPRRGRANLGLGSRTQPAVGRGGVEAHLIGQHCNDLGEQGAQQAGGKSSDYGLGDPALG